jgi:hypothetical protein
VKGKKMKRILYIKGKHIRGHYYHDGSGEIDIVGGVNLDNTIYYNDNDRMWHHLKDIQNKIVEYTKAIETLKEAEKLFVDGIPKLKTLKRGPDEEETKYPKKY